MVVKHVWVVVVQSPLICPGSRSSVRSSCCIFLILINIADTGMSEMSPQELEVARLIIDTLNLEDIGAEEIDPNEALFNEGLGLDSIDALELALAISKRYGFQLRSDDADNARIFSSLRTLSEYIAANRAS